MSEVIPTSKLLKSCGGHVFWWNAGPLLALHYSCYQHMLIHNLAVTMSNGNPGIHLNMCTHGQVHCGPPECGHPGCVVVSVSTGGPPQSGFGGFSPILLSHGDPCDHILVCMVCHSTFSDVYIILF